ncbi:hypothetical protein EB093_03020, partial [bacterium]|nr:hypothetical protein [bacterium]
MQRLITTVSKGFKLLQYVAVAVIATISLSPRGLNAAPIQFADYFLTRDGRLLDGDFPVTASLVATPSQTVLWTYSPSLPLSFTKGYFALEVAEQSIDSVVFRSGPVVFRLEANNSTATFPISSMPFALKSIGADYAKRVSGNSIRGTFSTLKVDSSLNVSSRNLLFADRTGVGVLRRAPQFPLDVNGVINASKFTVAGIDLRDLFPWKVAVNSPENIYTSYPFLAIGGDYSPSFAVNVTTTINATGYLIDGRPITASQDWVRTGVGNFNLYLTKGGRVGIGNPLPAADVDVVGGILVSKTNGQLPGTIRWAIPSVGNALDFQGSVDDVDSSGNAVTVWKSLVGLRNDGRQGRIAYFSSSNGLPELSYGSGLVYSAESGYLGIGGTPSSLLQITAPSRSGPNLFNVVGTTNVQFMSIAASGDVSIGSDYLGSKLGVSGLVNAQDLYVDGTPLRLSVSKGTFWLRNGANSIYYMHGNVGIGRFDPQSLLDISAPLPNQGEVTKNPAITFTSALGLLGQTSYTAGILATDNGAFRVEKSTTLGGTTPLFVAVLDRLGVGLVSPKANLHVSGNLGLLLGGTFDSGVTVSASGAGARMTWHPAQSALRVGVVDATSPLGGTEWDYSNIGLYSIGIGLNPLPSGNHSIVVGGVNGKATGAFSSVFSGRSNVTVGDFTLGLGRASTVVGHGSFVWSDNSTTVGLRSVTENQFLIRASGGVGIGTPTPSWRFSGSDVRSSALTVAGIRITPATLLGTPGLVSNTLDFYSKDWASISWDASVEIFNTLVLAGYLTPEGIITSLFQSGVPMILPSNSVAFSKEAILRQIFESTRRSKIISFNNSEGPIVSIRQAGNLNIGVNSSLPGVFVSGNIEFNSPLVPATFGLQGNRPSRDLLAIYRPNAKLASPSMYISASLNVGIGKIPDLSVNGGAGQLQGANSDVHYFLDVQGRLYSNVFKFPDGQTLPTSNSPETWQWETTTPNIFFPSANILANGRINATGNVGIGTTQPNNTLELSNRSSLQTNTAISPVLAFDINGQDVAGLGISRLDTTTLRFVPGGESVINNTPPLAVYGNYVGVRTTRPRASFEVSGKTIILSKMNINNYNPALIFGGGARRIGVGMLSIHGSIYGWPSIQAGSETNIYWTTQIGDEKSYIGIGRSDPAYELDVSGSIRVTNSNGPAISVLDRFIFDQGLKELSHGFFNSANRSDPLQLNYVMLDNRELVLKRGDDYVPSSETDSRQPSVNNISQVITLGSGSGGYLGMWLETPLNLGLLGDSPLRWKSATLGNQGALESSYNWSVGSLKNVGNYVVSGNFSIIPNGQNALSINEHGYYASDLSQSGAFTGEDIATSITRWPDGPSNWMNGIGPAVPIPLKGLNVKLKNYADRPITLKGTVYGLVTDVSQVAIQSAGDRGYRSSAIFLGGKVGIGGTPNAELDVRGTVVSQFFKISNGLIISTINVQNNGLTIYSPNRIAIGNVTPSVALEVLGTVQTNQLIVDRGLDALSASISSASFVVLNNGTASRVGFGTSNPSSVLGVYHKFGGPVSEAYSAYKLEGVVGANANFPFYGLNVTLNAVNGISKIYGNQLGSKSVPAVGIGLKIDLSGLQLDPDYSLIGLETIGDPEINHKNAATFIGGNVGIGLSNPSYPLEVKGTIYGTNAPSARFLDQARVASFSYMTIAGDMFVSGPMIGSDVITNTLDLQSINLLSGANLPLVNLVVSDGTLISTFNVTDSVTAVDMQVNSSISSNVAQFTQLGVAIAPSTQLSAVGGVVAQTATINQWLSAGSALVNSGAFFVGASGLVGVGTTQPFSSVHVIGENGYKDVQFDPARPNSWGKIVVHVPSDQTDIGVGLRLYPGTTYDNSSGSGIVAQSYIDSASSIERHLDLVFITDDRDAFPKEHMRIRHDGKVGIGTSRPVSMLDVVGNTIVSGGVSVNSVNLSGGIFGSSLSFLSNVEMTVTTNISGNLILPRTLLTPISNLSPQSGQFALFTKSSNSGLYLTTYQDGKVISANFGQATVAPSTSFPVYGIDNVLGGTQSIYWDSLYTTSGENKLRIGSVSQVNYTGNSVLAGYYSTVSSSDSLGSVSVSTQKIGVGPRVLPSNTIIVGTGIGFDGDSNVQDVVGGVKVVVSGNVKSRSYAPDGTPVNGNLAVAIFTAGNSSSNVAIISTTNSITALPDSRSDLFILNQMPNQAAFQLDILDSLGGLANSFSISSTNSNVGVYTSSPYATFTLNSLSGYDRVSVKNFNAKSLFSIASSDVLTIGDALPVNQMSVTQNIIATAITANIIRSGTSFTAGPSSSFVVNSTGMVGLGISSPLAQIHQRRVVSYPSALTSSLAFFSSQIMTQPGNSGVLQSAIGSQISVTSNYGGNFGVTGAKNVFKAVNVNLSGTLLSSGSKMIGVKVNIAPGASVAAMFNGGNVGVGTVSPKSVLSVAGTLAGQNVFVSTPVDWNLVGVTSNRFVVSTDAQMSTFESTNFPVIVLDTIQIDSFASDTRAPQMKDLPYLNSSQLIASVSSVNRLFVGTSYATFPVNTNAVEVSGNTRFKDTVIRSGEISSNLIAFDGQGGIASAVSTNKGVNFQNSLISPRLTLSSVSDPTVFPVEESYLYVAKNSGDALIFVNKTSGYSSDIARTLLGDSNHLLYFDASRQIASDLLVQLVTRNTVQEFQVGTSNLSTRNSGKAMVVIKSDVGTTAGVSN